MLSIKNIFCLLFLLCTLHTTFFASLPMAKTTLLFRSKSFDIRNKNFKRPYHINQPTQNKNVGWPRWKEVAELVFCPNKLSMEQGKGIKGLTEEERLFLTEAPDKTIGKMEILQKQKEKPFLAELAQKAVSESEKKMARRLLDAQPKKEEN